MELLVTASLAIPFITALWLQTQEVEDDFL